MPPSPRAVIEAAESTLMRTWVGVGVVLSLGALIFPAWGLAWLGVLTLGGALWARHRGWSARDWPRELDELAEAGERALVAGALSVMTLAVFLDVVWRTSHSLDDTARWVFGAILFGLSLMGGFTAHWPGATWGRRLLAGLAAFVVIVAGIRLIHAAPHGFGWSQRLALVLLMWVGLLGASLASKWGRHIQVDAVRRVVPLRWQRSFEVTAELLTLALLFFLALLAREYAESNWIDWSRSEGRSAVFESLPIPYFAASAPIVIGFVLMLGRSLRALVEGPVKAQLLESLGGGDRSAPTDGREESREVSAP